MLIYAGIDEAGYGPLLGPMVIARAIFQCPDITITPNDLTKLPNLWNTLDAALCSNISQARKTGKLPVNDSKKLHQSGPAGYRWLEAATLIFSNHAGHTPKTLRDWIEAADINLQSLANMPWYLPESSESWPSLPKCNTPDELAIRANMLRRAMQQANITLPEPPRTAIIPEHRFNDMVTQTRSKAAVSFTFVAQHLCHIIDTLGQHHPIIVIDRQGGRSHYRELLAMLYPKSQLQVLREDEQTSLYTLRLPDRAATICFTTKADQDHLPVALASMAAKYTRELLMDQFNAYFTKRIAGLKPTAGYATDGKRFLNDLRPHLPKLNLTEPHLRRIA